MFWPQIPYHILNDTLHLYTTVPFNICIFLDRVFDSRLIFYLYDANNNRMRRTHHDTQRVRPRIRLQNGCMHWTMPSILGNATPPSKRCFENMKQSKARRRRGKRCPVGRPAWGLGAKNWPLELSVNALLYPTYRECSIAQISAKELFLILRG